MKPSTSRWDGLFLAQLMSLLLLCLCYLRIVGDTQSAAFMNLMLDALFEGPIW